MFNEENILSSQVTAKDIPALFEIAQNKKNGFNFRHDAIIALGKIGPKAIPKLSLILQDIHPGYRQAAIRAIGSMGLKGIKAYPQLAKHLNDEDGEVGLAAVSALSKLGTKPLNDFQNVLKEKYISKEVCIAVLPLLGTHLPQTLDTLVKATCHRYNQVSQMSTMILLRSKLPRQTIINAINNLITAYSGRIFHSFRSLVSTDSGNNFPGIPELVSTHSGFTFHPQSVFSLARSEATTVLSLDSSLPAVWAST